MWSGKRTLMPSMVREPGSGGLRGSARQTFAAADRQIEAVLGWRERAGPARIEGARRLVGEVEVNDERAPGRIAAEVGALRGVDEIAAGRVRLGAVRLVPERDEDAARVAGHPERGERPFASGEGERYAPDPRERQSLRAAVGELQGQRAGRRRRRRLDDDLEAERWVVL